MRRPLVALVATLAAVVVLATTAAAVTMSVRDDGNSNRSHPMMRTGMWNDPAPDSPSGGWMHGGGGGLMMGGVVVRDEFAYLTHMVAHHQEAVDAARQLARSERPQMRAFGRNIVATQSAQIDQMRAWLATWYPGRSTDVDYRPMMRDLTGLSGDRLDRMFLQDMVVHHMAAVMMSQQLLAHGSADHPQVEDLARTIRDEQHAEIFQMRDSAHHLVRMDGSRDDVVTRSAVPPGIAVTNGAVPGPHTNHRTPEDEPGPRTVASRSRTRPSADRTAAVSALAGPAYPASRGSRRRPRSDEPRARPVCAPLLPGEPTPKPNGVAQIGGCGSYWMPRRTSRARSVPASRATRCRAMSMPAETPALVMRSPSSTNRAATSVLHGRVELGEQVQRRPVRGRRPAREQSGGGVDEASGAHRGHQRHGCALGAHPVQVLGVAEQPAGAVAARVDEDVEGGSVVQGVVGAEDQALGAGDACRRRRTGTRWPSRPRGAAASSTRGPPRARRRRAPRRRRRAAARCGAGRVGRRVRSTVSVRGGCRMAGASWRGGWLPGRGRCAGWRLSQPRASAGWVAPVKVPGSPGGRGPRGSTVAGC